jgi:hypothetical protein
VYCEWSVVSASYADRTVGLLFLLYNEEAILLKALPRVFQIYFFDKHKGIGAIIFENVELHLLFLTFNNKNMLSIELYL